MELMCPTYFKFSLTKSPFVLQPPMTQLPNTFIDDFGLEAVLQYITQLDIDDIDDLQSRNARADTSLTDEEFAKLLFAEEARSLLSVTRDHIAGPSVSDPSILMDELFAMEEMARFDHEMALALAEDRPLPVRPESVPRSRIPSVVTRPPTSEPEESEDDSESDASSVASSDGTEEVLLSAPVHECTVCGDPISGPVVNTLCGHTYDIECLKVMFLKATEDESLFPPSCCRISIPLTDVEEYFDEELVDLFGKKSVEFSTPNRVYCSQPTCSVFLGPAGSKMSSIYCHECASTTCGLCKQAAHLGRPCTPEITGDSDVLNMGKDAGWQRCYSCKHLVELNHGCFHITCLCKAQFCYLCAAPWKTCACPQFEEAML